MGLRSIRRRCAATGVLAVLLSSSPAVASETQTYTYDELGRLTAVQYSGSVNNGQAHSLCYDPAGNRTNYKSDSAGALASCTSGGGGAPSFGISNASVTEGGTLSFTVTKTGSTSSSFSVNYATASGTATSGTDFTAKSGTLTFTAAETSKPVSVTTTQDSTVEPNETVLVNLTNATGGATISDTQGIGTITNDDSSNQPPVANPDSITLAKCRSGSKDVIANDTDPEGNTPLVLTAVDASWAWVSSSTTVGISAPDTNGTYTANYTVRDSLGATSTGTLTLTVSGSQQCVF